MVTSSWVLKPGWIPALPALWPTFSGFLRFISGAIPADLAASIAAEPFLIDVHIFICTVYSKNVDKSYLFTDLFRISKQENESDLHKSRK